MKKLIIIILLVSAFQGFSQVADDPFDQFIAAYKAKNLAEMHTYSDKYLAKNSDDYVGYVFKGMALLSSNKLAEAKKYIYAAKRINPLDLASYAMVGYYELLAGNEAEGKKQLEFAFQIKSDNNALAGIVEDIETLEHFLSKDLTHWKQLAKEWDVKYSQSPELMKKFYSCNDAWENEKSCPNGIAAINAFKKMSPYNSEIEAIGLYYKANYQYTKGQYALSDESFEVFLNHSTTKASTVLSYPKATANYYLSEAKQYSYNYNAMYLSANEGLNQIQQIGLPTILECNLMHKKILALGNLDRKKESLNLAYSLLKKATDLNYPLMQAHANNTIGTYFLNSTLKDDRDKAYKHIQQASKIANEMDDDPLAYSFSGNYAIVSWQQGKKQESGIISGNAIDYFEKNKDYIGAQLIANNIGFMRYYSKDYDRASDFFKRAVEIAEKYRIGLTPAQKLEVMNEHSSAYSGLIMCYKALGKSREMFEVQDKNRSRNLSENLNKNIGSANLLKVQENLKEHEVMLYYSELSPGEMVVNVITKREVTMGYSYPIKDWLVFKKNYINRVNKTPNSINGYIAGLNEEIINGTLYSYKDIGQGFSGKDYKQMMSFTTELLSSKNPEMMDIQEQFIKHWYKHLIQPIKSKITGKKTLIISVEGAMNYLPFEALKGPNGKYLIEEFNVKYIPSATVWLELKNRNYSSSRKDLVAFGGATYQSPDNNKSSIDGIEGMYKVQSTILDNLRFNYNFSKELMALGFGGADYLSGTLKEVENLKSIIPGATIKTGIGMKESVFKSMNASGELANFKYIHLATHGFALDNIPQLSGIMMTQPDNGDGKEDMFLLAHEIAALNIKADLFVLSACETALGKTYGGEGVNGLNSAILTAGANNSLLSLWSVSDNGTMLFMTLVYNNLYNSNQSMEDAICNAKRDMLLGKYGDTFKTPYMWAPFVLSGR